MRKDLFAFGTAIFLCVVFAGFESHAATFNLSVDANATGSTWSHFYEKCVGTCHPRTIISDGWGNRTIRNALRRGHNECGFTYFRGHNILGDAQPYVSAGNYNWTTLDRIYDSAMACGIKPVVELSGMPNGLNSGGNTTFSYGMNITPPNDYNNWRDLVRALVTHLEARYGVSEVRNNWAFEVWNEPNLGSFFSGSQTDYLRMFDYAAEGVRLADSLCRIGGPAVSGGNGGSDWVSAFARHVTSETNYATDRTGGKCDFISYHRYANDVSVTAGGVTCGSQVSSPTVMNNYHKIICYNARSNGFTGPIWCTEWAPTYNTGSIHSDQESPGSFYAKTIHLLTTNNLTTYPLPEAYSWWCISDIFEEYSTNGGNNRAYRGYFGMMLSGDNSVPASFDLPKSEYNVSRMLYQLTDIQVPLTGGTTGDGVNGVATRSTDGQSLQILLYNHYNGGSASPASYDSVSLTVNNIPFAPGAINVEYWLVDQTHSSAYYTWQQMGSPGSPSSAQWTQMKAVAELMHGETPYNITLTGAAFTKSFRLNYFGVGLINLKPATNSGINHGQKTAGVKQPQPSVTRGENCILVFIPDSRSKVLKIFDLHGKLVFAQNNTQQGYFRIDRGRLGKGVFILADNNGILPKINPLVSTR